MPRAFVSVGSNVNREQNIRSAVNALRAHYGEVARSPVYETSAVGFDGDPFYNLVVAFDTEEPIEKVNEQLRAIERAHGRRRGLERFAPRTLDLDLLLYGDVVNARLPRQEILQYAFVLRPLAELAPNERHPRTGQTYRELWLARAMGEKLRTIDYRFDV